MKTNKIVDVEYKELDPNEESWSIEAKGTFNAAYLNKTTFKLILYTIIVYIVVWLIGVNI